MLLRATFVAAAILTAAIGSASPAQSEPGGCYIAKSGDCVPYPAPGTAHDRLAQPQYVRTATTRAVNTPTPAAHATATAACSSICESFDGTNQPSDPERVYS